jgi:drug/metabolite transporter (DMT)-like permease
MVAVLRMAEQDGAASGAGEEVELVAHSDDASRSVLWFGTLAVVSTILTVVNKLLMIEYPFANTILLLQSTMSAALLGLAKHAGWIEVHKITFHQCSIFLASSIIKVLQVITALHALPYVAIATTMVFRNFAIVATAICDCTFFGRTATPKTVFALVLVLCGGVTYTGTDIHFNTTGYIWLTVNASLYVASVLYNKVVQTRLQDQDEQTAHGNALIEQTWMVIWGLGFVSGTGELEAGAMNHLWELRASTLVWFAATGAAAPILGTAYARCFAISSPTTVTVASTVNKCIAIFIAAVTFGTHLSWSQYTGLLITVVGGAWYGVLKRSEKK